MPRPLLNEEELKSWILRKLGAPLWRVELTCLHLDDCLDDAKRWFSAKKGLQKLLSVELAAGQKVYELPDFVETIIEVADSWRFGTIVPNLSAAFGWDQVVVGEYWPAHNHWPLSGLVQRMQYLEQTEKILDSRFEWQVIDRKLFVMTPNNSSVKLAIIYKTNEIVLDQLPERDYDLVRRFALMCAKKTLGRIRSKYPGGFPTAQGTVDLDGQILLDEAREERERLEEEIQQSGYPMFFLTG